MSKETDLERSVRQWVTATRDLEKYKKDFEQARAACLKEETAVNLLMSKISGVSENNRERFVTVRIPVYGSNPSRDDKVTTHITWVDGKISARIIQVEGV